MTTDQQNADYYEEPAHREAGGIPRGRKRGGEGRMTSHVAVRFPSDLIQKVRQLAIEDGLSVSGWIRTVVDGEVASRLPAHPATNARASHLTVVSTSGWTAGIAVSSSELAYPENTPVAVSD